MDREIGLRSASAAHHRQGAQRFSPAVSAALQHDLGISWGESTARVTAYWQAVGVRDEDQLTALTRQVMQRVDTIEPLAAGSDLAMLAVEEARRMLDEWLAGLLGIEQAQLQQLAMARAALLSGALPGWPAALLGANPAAVAGALRKAPWIPVPGLIERPMGVQKIELFSRRLSSRCRRGLRQGRVAVGKLMRKLVKH